MRIHSSHGLSAVLALAAFTACQPEDNVNPEDDNTGTPPAPATQIYSFDAATAPTFLDANLEQTIAPRAAFMVDAGVLVAMPANGVLPDVAGEDANLVGGVGFGTYSNPDQLGAGVDWASADPFRAVVEAEITLHNPGDQVALCRSFATTCATVIFDPQGSGSGVGVIVLNLAANLPDTEIGEIAPGVSAAIREAGDSGLTVAVTDQSAVVVPFLATAGTPFTLRWSTERGDVEGSLDFSVAINGTELKTGNTATILASSIVKDGGVALVFDQQLGNGDVDVSYVYGTAQYIDFTACSGHPTFCPDEDIEAVLSHDPWSGFTPLKVYPTEDPAWPLAGTTLAGNAGPHGVQWEDGVYGAIAEAPAAGARAFVYSKEFDGDDFEGTAFESMFDQGGEGGGFFPSPSLCYSQILPIVEEKVRDEVRKEVHRAMYATIANGVLQVDASLVQLVAALNANFGQSLTYTRVGNIGTGDIAGYVTIGTDYADNNVDDNITTSCEATYTVTLTNSTSTTFVTQFNAFITALEANNFTIRDALIGAGSITLNNYISFKQLQAGLTTPPGVKDGKFGTTECALDELPFACEGYECNVGLVIDDIVYGTNYSGQNPGDVSTLPVACEWGIPPEPATVAVAATVTGSVANDHPAYAAQAAVAGVAPVREQASASMNALVQGLFANFVIAAYGQEVPASNFSVKLSVGDPASGESPGVSKILITKE